MEGELGVKDRLGDLFVPHQFLAWAGLHVIGVRIRVLQRVATLETKEKTTVGCEEIEESLENAC